MTKSFFPRLNRPLPHYVQLPFRALGHIIAQVVFSPPKAEYPFTVQKGTNILFLRHDALGDMICTLPMFRLVKKNFPDACIHVVCTNANKTMIENCEFVDQVHVADAGIGSAPLKHLGRIQELRLLHCDIIVNCLTSKASKNGILTALISGKKSLTSSIFSGKRYELYYSTLSHKASSMQSMWDKMFMLGVETFGLQFSDADRKAILPSKPEHKALAEDTLDSLGLKHREFIAVNVSAGQKRNRWSLESCIHFIEYLHKKGLQPLIFGMENDRAFIDALHEQFPGMLQYPYGRHVLEVGEALKKASWGCTPDTGFLHLATAAECPVVALYCHLTEQSINEWAPFRIPFERVISHTESVADISSDLIINAAERLMASLQSS